MNIKISKNAHACAACGNDFQHEQELTSTVKVAEGVLHRLDFCRDCWDNEQNKDTYSVWSMVYHDPKIENQEPPEVFSPLRQLFYEAAEEDSRIEMAKAFLAAGLLRRQKVFRLIKESDESDGDVRITLYTDRIGNRLIEVPDPQFTYAEMDKARLLLIERLQELEKAAAGTPDVVATESPTATTTSASDTLDEVSDDDEVSSEDADDIVATKDGEGVEDEEEEEEDEFDDDEDDDEDDDDDDDEEEYDDDDDDDDEDEEELEDVEDDDEADVDEEVEEEEVKLMESALAGRESIVSIQLGAPAFANEEALHAQA